MALRRKVFEKTKGEILIPEGIESKIRIEFIPINHKNNRLKYDYFQIIVPRIPVENFDFIPPKELIVEGFEKRGVYDFGAYNRGFSFYANHPTYGKIEITRGTEYNKSFECNRFECLYFLGEKHFKLSDYNSEQTLEREIEDYFIFLREEIKKFTENFNKAVKNKMGKSTLNSEQILNNLKSKYNLS